jgi:SpoVK/Ycf46/Vps4 family AAA+-type ATPase
MDDVDLVFASRDINQHGGALGDLFDQIDAISDAEPISIVMTTNAIERVEAAVKDRPGRVSQCIFFGPPSSELRRRYLEVQLRGHDRQGVDLDEIVRKTDGATQAYLKELCHRALQFALEADRLTDDVLRPATADFAAALDEINAFDSKAARSITGFRLS